MFYSKNKFTEFYLVKISAKYYNKKNMNTYLVGDVRFSEEITPIETKNTATLFLLELESLMNLYAVVKVDISIDPYKFNDKNNK